MKLKAVYSGGTKFKVKARGHEIEIDQPLDKGGKDEGPTPTEVFLSSMAACIGIYGYFFCKNNNIDPDGMEVDIEGEYADRPRRIGRIEVKITPPAGVEGKLEKKFMKYAEQCTIHNTLLNKPEITTVIVRK